jgi:hypothetical protein
LAKAQISGGSRVRLPRVEPPSHRYGVPRDNAFRPPKKNLKKSLAMLDVIDKTVRNWRF